MAKKNLPKVKALRSDRKLSSPALSAEIKGIVFDSDPDATHPFFDDATTHGKADDLGKTLADYVTDPTPANTAVIAQTRAELLFMVDANTNYADTIANKSARQKGDINAGIDVLRRLGIRSQASPAESVLLVLLKRVNTGCIFMKTNPEQVMKDIFGKSVYQAQKVFRLILKLQNSTMTLKLIASSPSPKAALL